LLVCNWPHSVGQNHFIVMMLFNRDSAIQKSFRRFCLQVRKSPVPCQPSGRSCHPVRMPICPSFHPSGRHAIPSGRPTNQASSVRTTYISVRTFTVSRSYCSSLHPSGRLSSPSGRLSMIDQLQILSKFNLREDCFNRPDDVDFHLDVLIHKARIAIQYHRPDDSQPRSGRAFNS
jgi:hypothetical protein